MAQLFKNFASAELAAPIAAADTSLTVNIVKADRFPAANTGSDPVPTVGKDFYKIVIEDVNKNREIAYVRTRTLGSAIMANLLRGQEGTTAISFAAGSVVSLRHTAQDLDESLQLSAQATTPGKDLLWAASVDDQVEFLGGALQKQLVHAFTTDGTSTAYGITPTPAVEAYAAHLTFDVTFDETCGANPTLAISGLPTPPNLVKQLPNGSYANLAAGDVIAGHRSRVTLLSPTQALVERLPRKFSNFVPDIASAATLDLSNLDGDIAIVTGSDAVSAVTMNNGQRACLIAAGALPLTYHTTNLPVQGGVSRTCVPGDMLVITKSRAGTLHTQFIPVSGLPVIDAVYVQPGLLAPFGQNTAPQGYLKANGAAVSRTTYAALFAALVKTATVTLTLGSPGTVNWTAHGRSVHDPVKFTTTGALLTGLTAGTTYYVIASGMTADSFRVSATPGGSAINFTGTQSGVHTAIHAPHGDGDGSTTFNVPDMRGEFPRGWDDGRGVDTNRAFGSAQAWQLASHAHTYYSTGTAGVQGGGGDPITGITPGSGSTATAGGTENSSENRPRNVALLWCIKY